MAYDAQRTHINIVKGSFITQFHHYAYPIPSLLLAQQSFTYYLEGHT